MREWLEKIHRELVWILIGVIGVFCLLLADLVKADSPEPAGTITINIGGIIKTYPANEYKVEKVESVCYQPADPCLECKTREKKLIEELHKKMSFPCAPCRKCEKELVEIKQLKDRINDLTDKLDEANNELLKLAAETKFLRSKPDTIKTEIKTETVKEVTHRSILLEGIAGYGEDGLIAYEYGDSVGYHTAETYSGLIVGGGVTWMITDRLGLGVQAQFGEISQAYLGKVVFGLW